MSSRLLVVGVRPGSLGEAIASNAREDWNVVTAGIEEEEYPMDITQLSSVQHAVQELKPGAVVVTAGVNLIANRHYPEDYKWSFTESFKVNVTGPMSVLAAWMQTGQEVRSAFVAISSNSAHIARRNSASYCASKAALSMALRVAGR